MEDTEEFESRMRSLDERANKLMERSKLELEISRLESQLQRMEVENATGMQHGMTDDGYVRSKGTQTLRFGAHSDQDICPDDKYTMGRLKQPGADGSYIPPCYSPIADRDSHNETDRDPCRFITERRKGKQEFSSSTPKPGSKSIKNEDKIIKPGAGVKMKPATYDGSGSWRDYKAHFEVCATLNGWSDKEMGMYLAVSLRGQAQGVYGNLGSGPQTTNYKELVRALEERFAPPNQTELYRVQLRERRQKASESLSELGQDISRLTNLAYPTAPSDVRETLAKEQFVDALVNSEMRIRIKQSRPSNLNDAVRHAVELEAYNKAEKRHSGTEGYMRSASENIDEPYKSLKSDMDRLQNTVTQLSKTVETLSQVTKSQAPDSRSNSHYQAKNKSRTIQHEQRKRRCYICGSEDHMRPKCPTFQKPKGSTQKSKSHDSKYVAATGSGLYVDFKINGIMTEFLIDTGATLTIVSTKVWDLVSENSSAKLRPFKANIATASGEMVDIKGKGAVCLEICGEKIRTNIAVANIEPGAILGLDVMKSNACKLDLANNTLMIKNKACKLNVTGKIGCCKLSGVLYKINWGRSVSIHAVHCDRMMRASPQVFLADHRDSFPEESSIEETDIELPKTRRLKKKPIRKKDFGEHVRVCTQRRVKCVECGISFKKNIYLQKHIKAKHETIASQSTAVSRLDETSHQDDQQESSESNWDSEPDVDIDERSPECREPTEDDLKEGRIIRKRTAPTIVTAKRQRLAKDCCEGAGRRQDQDIKTVTVAYEARVDKQMKKQDLVVTEGDKTMFSSSVACRDTNQKMGETSFRLSDCLGNGSINTSDVVLCITSDGKFEVRLKYRPM